MQKTGLPIQTPDPFTLRGARCYAPSPVEDVEPFSLPPSVDFNMPANFDVETEMDMDKNAFEVVRCYDGRELFEEMQRSHLVCNIAIIACKVIERLFAKGCGPTKVTDVIKAMCSASNGEQPLCTAEPHIVCTALNHLVAKATNWFTVEKGNNSRDFTLHRLRLGSAIGTISALQAENRIFENQFCLGIMSATARAQTEHVGYGIEEESPMLFCTIHG